MCIYVAHGKQRRSSSATSWYLSCGNVFYIVLWRSKSGLRFLYSYSSSRNSSRCSPLLSLTSPPRPRFCAEALLKPCWSTLRRGQPSTTTKPKKVDLMCVVPFQRHLRWDSRVYAKSPKSRPPNLGTWRSKPETFFGRDMHDYKLLRLEDVAMCTAAVSYV